MYNKLFYNDGMLLCEINLSLTGTQYLLVAAQHTADLTAPNYSWFYTSMIYKFIAELFIQYHR